MWSPRGPPVRRGQRQPQRIGQGGQVPARRPDRPTSAAMPARAGTPAHARPRERACRPRPNGLRRARTRAARESSQSRWRHEVEHHVNTRPRAGTRRIDPHRVAGAWLPRFSCFGQTRPLGRVIAAKKAAKSAAKSAAHHAAKTTASGSKLAAMPWATRRHPDGMPPPRRRHRPPCAT